LEIRYAENKDVRLVVTICREVANLYNSILPGAFEKQARIFEETGLPSCYDIKILSVNETDVGFIAEVDLTEEIFFLVGLYIRGRFQRMTYGSMALEKLIEELRGNNIKKLIVLVHDSAYWAKSFYAKNGFKIEGTTKEEAIRFHKRLERYYIKDTVLMSLDLI
jgi:GNAT superfamily N-acetyltransferase